MTDVVKNEENFYTIDNEADETLESNEDYQFEFSADRVEDLGPAQILRIEGSLNTSWGGVRGCSSRTRAASKIQAELDSWAAAKIKEFNKLLYRRHGAIAPVKFSYRNRTDWDGERTCRGWSNFKCYIEFNKAD
tara:strand:- start:186 stop:587 length:402 start_codon:yes stop_codon:yes gene_type:complete